MKKDALGNPIIIGNTYGYSQNQNGVTYVRIGKAIKETNQKITLKVEESKTGIYNNELKNNPLQKDHISVKSNMLFPINKKQK